LISLRAAKLLKFEAHCLSQTFYKNPCLI